MYTTFGGISSLTLALVNTSTRDILGEAETFGNPRDEDLTYAGYRQETRAEWDQIQNDLANEASDDEVMWAGISGFGAGKLFKQGWRPG